MPIEALFSRNTDAIRRYLHDPTRTLMCIQRDPDMEVMIKRLLAKLDDAEPDVVLFADESPYGSEAAWCEAVLSGLLAQQEIFAPQFAAGGIKLPKPLPPATEPLERLAAYVVALARALKPVADSVAFIFLPRAVSSPADWESTVCALSDKLVGSRAKLIITDDRLKPELPAILAKSRAGFAHPFHISPQMMLAELEHDLSPDGALGRLPRAQLTPEQIKEVAAAKAMLAGFLSSSGRVDEAAAIHEEALAQAEAAKDAAAEAQALYNLGTTRIGQHRYAEAEALLDRAAGLSHDAKNSPLLAMSLTNLGVSLERQRKGERSILAFDTAAGVYRNIGHRPGEAHVLDCKAGSLASLGRHGEARESWERARALYDSISAPAMTDVRAGGLADIDGKLARHAAAPDLYTPAPHRLDERGQPCHHEGCGCSGHGGTP
jgi:tetratricopeptide (TPR) repeat protein